MTYVPLWVKSHFSFLEGASHPDELVDAASRYGLPAMALTDRHGVYGMVRASLRAKETGLKLLVGSEVTIDDGSRVLLVAMTRRGYGHLCRLVSGGQLRAPKGECRVSWREVCAWAEELTALLPGQASVLMGKRYRRVVPRLREAFDDRLYALVTRHRTMQEPVSEALIRERAAEFAIATVAGTEVLYHDRARRPLQDIVTCIRLGVTLTAAGTQLRSNAEHGLLSATEMLALFADDPASVRRTLEVAARCSFSLADIRYRYPSEALPSGMDSSTWLRTLTFEGAQTRYAEQIPASVIVQLHKELSVIHDLDYEGYFLTMYEVVQFCRRGNILCQGRGSAANSAVCYCLGITAVDPVRMGLLFERFLSKERAEPPDIDLDIEHDRREEVIQFVYEKYGRIHAAMVANVVRYRARSAIRDVGKVLGISETMIDRYARRLAHRRTVDPEFRLKKGNEIGRTALQQLTQFTRAMQDVPRHLSIHPGGFVLGHERVDTLVPIEPATMPGRTVIQWDKEDVEALGLFKVDLLGLGALNVVHRACDLLARHHGRSETLATIPPADQATFDMISRGDTVGVFQIESRAQMSMLPRLCPQTYYDLVIEISLVRPGPIHGGMVHPYLRRRDGLETVHYPHPSLEPILRKTLGVPLFQEQVMQLAIVAADYTPGEADQLRRDMAAWRKSGRIERHRERLIARMTAKGIDGQFAEQVFEQIRGFGEYGFPESHAASFALIAYAMAWLKCRYPATLLCALLNAQPMGFYTPATLIDDAKRHGVAVLPVDVHVSQEDCTLEPCAASAEGYAVRMGLRSVKGLREEERRRILRGRPFASVDALMNATDLRQESVTALAEAGALETLHPQRRGALWSVLRARAERPITLPLAVPSEPVVFPSLNTSETIAWDYRTTGHSTHGHPLAPLREQLDAQGLPDAAAVRRMVHGAAVRYAGLVICRQHPGTAKGVVFMTLEDESGFVNLVVWEREFRANRYLATAVSFLGVTGTLQTQGDVVHIVVKTFWTPCVRESSPTVLSRDFQ